MLINYRCVKSTIWVRIDMLYPGSVLTFWEYLKNLLWRLYITWWSNRSNFTSHARRLFSSVVSFPQQDVIECRFCNGFQNRYYMSPTLSFFFLFYFYKRFDKFFPIRCQNLLPYKFAFEITVEAPLDEIKENLTRQLMVIPKGNFTYCFENWER